MNTQNKRLNYIDIAKGIGIISVVWAHTLFYGSYQISIFHMPLFFFLSGLTFNTEKSVENITKSRFIRLYLPFLVCSIIYVPFNNYFVKLGASDKNIISSLSDYLVMIIKPFLFIQNTDMFASIWFLSCLFFSSVIVSLIYKTYTNLSENILSQIILAIVFWSVGHISNCLGLLDSGINYGYNFGVIFQSVAIIILGIACKNRISFLKWYIAVIGALYIIVAKILGCGSDYRAGLYFNLYLYPLGVIGGIYLVIYLAKCIEKTILCNLFIKIGKSSLWILPIHFFIIKILNVYVRTNSIIGWALCLSLGVFIPFIMYIFWENIKLRFRTTKI